MAESPNKQLQTDAAAAILKRIKHLAPKASALELKKLADAYAAVADKGGDFDPRNLFAREFNPFARFADRDPD